EVVSVLAFEKLTFGVEELRLLSAYAEESQSRLLGYCLEDLFEIANMSSNVSERPGCPEQLSAALRHTLLTLHSQSATTSLLKLLSTLATHELSPCLSGEVPVALPEEKRREVSVLAEQIRELVDLPAFVLGKREVSGPPLLAARPPVVLLDETTPDMGEAGWTARLTYAMVLARPEFMLVTCLSSASLYDHLEIASIAINPLRHKSADYPKEILAQYQTVLSDSRYSPLHMPRISQATLPQLKQLAQSSRRMAIQVALHFSQSLRDCLEILCETENVRLPTSLAGLKSAMKQSPVIKGLVLYAMSPQAQKIHRQMFDD
ncbi:MAG: hypothetical protein FWC40_07085, partial [Proteobacteria bacterium]|nr:hypothetical protein [Pseudomonadota bacterium]